MNLLFCYAVLDRVSRSGYAMNKNYYGNCDGDSTACGQANKLLVITHDMLAGLPSHFLTIDASEMLAMKKMHKNARQIVKCISMMHVLVVIDVASHRQTN